MVFSRVLDYSDVTFLTHYSLNIDNYISKISLSTYSVNALMVYPISGYSLKEI